MPTLKTLIGGINALFHRDQRTARIEMGSLETVKENVHCATWESTAQSIAQDFRYGIRQLRRGPGFTAIAILSLALGIGANTIIFTLAKGVLLDRLAVPRPNQLRLFAIRRDRRNSPQIGRAHV